MFKLDSNCIRNANDNFASINNYRILTIYNLDSKKNNFGYTKKPKD